MPLNLPGFAQSTGSIPKRMTVASQGEHRKGKTDFAIRGLPAPVGVISSDRNFKAVAEKLKIELPHREVYYREFIKDPVQVLLDSGPAHVAWWDSIKKAYYELVKAKEIKSIFIDTGTEMWDFCRLAHLGKLEKVQQREYGAPNRDMTDMFNACDKHMIISHKVKPEWKNNAPTGRNVMEGYKETPFICNVQIEHFREKDGTFGIRILNSTANPALREGAADDDVILKGEDMCNFQFLGITVFPQTDIDYWK